MSAVVTATEVVRRFPKVLRRAHDSGAVVIEKNGQPVAQLSPIRSPLTGAQILSRLRRAGRPRMTPAEAASFAADVESVRAATNLPPELAAL